MARARTGQAAPAHLPLLGDTLLLNSQGLSLGYLHRGQGIYGSLCFQGSQSIILRLVTPASLSAPVSHITSY